MNMLMHFLYFTSEKSTMSAAKTEDRHWRCTNGALINTANTKVIITATKICAQGTVKFKIKRIENRQLFLYCPLSLKCVTFKVTSFNLLQ